MLYREGDTIDAWDRSPKYNGHRIAQLRVTRDAYPQNTSEMDDTVYEREGFAYMDESGYRPLAMAVAPGKPKNKMWRAVFDRWCVTPKDFWIVEFTLLSRDN